MAKRYQTAARDAENRQKPTAKLKALIADLKDPAKRIIFVDGLPSTGKTKSAIDAAMDQLGRQYYKIVYCRPVIIPKFGFLPGGAGEKMAYQTAQASEYIQDCSLATIDDMIRDKTLEVMPLDQLQGRRFRSAYVVIDEVQNVHWTETYKILTRMGEGCKYVVIGDSSEGQQDARIKKDNLLCFCRGLFGEDNDNRVAVHTFFDQEKDLLGDDFTKYIVRKLIPHFLGEGADGGVKGCAVPNKRPDGEGRVKALSV